MYPLFLQGDIDKNETCHALNHYSKRQCSSFFYNLILFVTRFEILIG